MPSAWATWLDSATNATLSFSNLSATNAGFYTVEVTGACNTVTNSAMLLVREITTASALTSAVRCTGEGVTFETTVSGTGPFGIVWRRNGVVLPAETGGSVDRQFTAAGQVCIIDIPVPTRA